MRWTITALRRVPDDLAPTLGVLLLVLVTAFAAALAPRVLAALGDRAIRSAIAERSSSERAITLVEHEVPSGVPLADPLEPARSEGAELRDGLPGRVRQLVQSTDLVIDSGRYRINAPTTDPAFFRLRIQQGIGDHVQYVQGGPPGPVVTTRDDVGPEHENDVPVYEVAISAATADRFDLELGQVVPLTVDKGDPLIGRGEQDTHAFVAVTGIYEVPDPAADFWRDDPLPIHPVIRALSAEVQLLDGVALIDPGAFPELADRTSRMTRSVRLQWRYGLDTASITERSAPALLRAFRALSVRYPSANVTASSPIAMRTGLFAILQEHQAAWTAAGSIIAVLAVGPALVALGTLALIATLAGRRRRSTMALARSRGASGAQILVPAGVEGVLLAIPAATLGLAAAVALVPAGQRTTTVLAAAVVAAAAVAVVVATVLPVARSLGGGSRPGGRAPRRSSGPRRLVAEAVIVGLAIGSAVLLRERGVQGTTAAGVSPGVDPLLAAVPALVGIAAGLVVLRVVPWLMRGAAAAAHRRRGLVPMLAARRGTEGGVATAILLVLLATATVGTFALVSLDSLDRGADLASWHETGGSYRLDVPNGALPLALDAAALPGVEASATEFRGLVPLGLSGPQTTYLAVNAAGLSQVLEGTPIAPAWPASMTEPGTGPIPAIVSQRLVDSPRGVRPGETFQLTVEGYTLTYLAAAVADTFPGVDGDRAFVVVPREWIRKQAPEARLIPTSAVLRAPSTPDAAAAIREAVAGVSPVVRIASQAEDAAARRAAPVTDAIRGVVIAAALITALYAALGVAAALALAALARVVEVAHLRTLGLTSRQAFLLTAAEHGPTTLLAFVAGVLLGAVLFAAVRPALGLDALVGVAVEVPVVIDPLAALGVLVMMALVVVLGLVAGSLLVRRVAPTAVLRGRFE